MFIGLKIFDLKDEKWYSLLQSIIEFCKYSEKTELSLDSEQNLSKNSE